MARGISILVLGLLVLGTWIAARDAAACSLDDYERGKPEVDRGFVAGQSPATPVVVEAFVLHDEIAPESGGGCPLGPQTATSCDGVVHTYLSLRLQDAGEAARFKLDFGDAPSAPSYVEPNRVEGDEVVVFALPRSDVPFSFTLTAYDADGYASMPVVVEVAEEFSDREGGGCALGRSPAGLGILAAGLLCVRRLRRPSRSRH